MVKLVDKQNIFNSGILSSKLYSRDDLKQYNNGISTALNFICSRYGPLDKRTGTEFICELLNEEKEDPTSPDAGGAGTGIFLLPFIFSIDQTLLLEFIDRKIRFYTFGTNEQGNFEFGQIKDPENPTEQYVIATPFKERYLKHVSYVQSLDVIYLAFEQLEPDPDDPEDDGTMPPYVLTRKDKYNWTIEPFETEDGPYLNQNYQMNRTVTITDTNTTSSVVTLQNFDLTEKDIGRWIRICTPRYNENTYAYEDKWSYGKIAGINNSSWKLDQTAAYSGKSQANTVVGTAIYSNSSKKTKLGNVTAVSTTSTNLKQITVAGKNYIYEKKINSEVWRWKEAYQIAYIGDVSDSNVYSDNAKTNIIGTIVERGTDKLTVSLTGTTKNSTFSLVTDGIIVDWSYRNFIDDADKSWMRKPTSEWRLGVWHDGYGNEDYPATYPTKVTIHQQRLVWAGMTDRPWIWMSNSFAYKNYAYSDYEGEITDTNSIYYDISSSKISDIFWIASIKSLLIGTELGEIRLYSGGTALTPNDVVSNMESSYGSYNADPILNDDNIVYIQRLQRTIRSLSYDYNQDAFVGPELTVLAEGLTVGGVKKLAFQKEPNNTYWCLKEDGSLLSLTYDRAQDVIGWSQSKIAGEEVKVIDMAVLPSNIYRQDMLILCVERKINGVTKRYLELLTKNFNNDVSQAEACYLDCAKRIPNEDDTPHKVITGLNYLEGQKVRVMDEGAYEGDYVVENGQITLATACKDVWVGLPYEAYLETLERDFQDKQLSTKMSKLRVYKLRMYIERSLGIEINRLDNGSESKLITFDPTKYMDTTPTLLTGKVDIPVPSAWDCDYRLRLKSEPGFPCTVAGFIIGVEVNEL